MAGIDVNFCKNPVCANYGVPAKSSTSRGRKADPDMRDTRYRVAAWGKGVPSLICLACNESIPMKSNLGVAEELERVTSYLKPAEGPCCRTEGCPPSTVPSPDVAHYVAFGTTAAGSARYRYRHCGKTLSVAAVGKGQRMRP